MGYSINLIGIKATAHIGVTEAEKRTPQTISIDLEIHPINIPKNDDIATAVDYAQITNDVRDIIGTTEYNLIETLGQTIKEHLLNDIKIKNVLVKVHKPDVDIDNIGDVFIEI